MACERATEYGRDRKEEKKRRRSTRGKLVDAASCTHSLTLEAQHGNKKKSDESTQDSNVQEFRDKGTPNVCVCEHFGLTGKRTIEQQRRRRRRRTRGRLGRLSTKRAGDGEKHSLSQSTSFTTY